jgi:hypothetical protein
VKECTRCKRQLPLSEFCKRRRSKDGLEAWCRECKNAYNKEYKRGKRTERWFERLNNLEKTLPKPDSIQLAYFGGIIDGEGSFVAKIYPDTDALYLDCHISNTNYKLGIWLIQHIGGHTGNFSVKPNQKPAYKWKLSRDEARLVIPKAMPYLILKKRHAEIYTELLASCGRRGTHSDKGNASHRLELVNELLKLNKKGPII